MRRLCFHILVRISFLVSDILRSISFNPCKYSFLEFYIRVYVWMMSSICTVWLFLHIQREEDLCKRMSYPERMLGRLYDKPAPLSSYFLQYFSPVLCYLSLLLSLIYCFFSPHLSLLLLSVRSCRREGMERREALKERSH